MTRLKVLLINSLCVFGAVAALPGEWSVIVSPDNSVEFGFVKSSAPAFNLGLAGWGPKWAWVGVNSREKAAGGRLTATVPFVVNNADGQEAAAQGRPVHHRWCEGQGIVLRSGF